MPDQLRLVALGAGLGRHPLDLAARLLDPLAQLRDLARHRLAPRPEHALLGRQRLGDRRRRLGDRRHRRGEAILPRALGLEPGLADDQAAELDLDQRERGPGIGRVEPDEHGTGLDMVAVADMDGGDHAAGGVLDPAQIMLQHDPAPGDHGARQGRRRGPDADGPEQDHQRRDPGQGHAADRAPGIGERPPGRRGGRRGQGERHRRDL